MSTTYLKTSLMRLSIARLFYRGLRFLNFRT